MDISEFLFPKNLRKTESGITKIIVIGSCLADQYVKRFSVINNNVKYHHILYNNVSELPKLSDSEILSYNLQYIQLPLRWIVTDKVINYKSIVNSTNIDSIISKAIKALRLMLSCALEYNNRCGLLTIVSNFFVPQMPVVSAMNHIGTMYDFAKIVSILNDELVNSIEGMSNVYIADVNSIGSAMGKRYFLDDSVGFFSHAGIWDADEFDSFDSPAFNSPARITPLIKASSIYETKTTEIYNAIWHQIEYIYRVVNQMDMVKMVIFDLDDTLWRGLIGEHYSDGASWPIFNGWPISIWEAVQHLRSRGILTAICSKNDENIVRERWPRAVNPPFIHFEDFALRAINWLPKSENVKDLIRKACLTPKSCVFIDDNPVERASIKAALPEIRVLGESPYEVRRILLWSSETQLPVRTNETTTRESSIKQLQIRDHEQSTMSRSEFLNSLGCQVHLARIENLDSSQFVRSLELINKTNQFNTTGIRWERTQLLGFVNIGGEILYFDAKDKYTDYGIVGVVLIRNDLIAQFAMSCRVIGLEIENAIIATIANRIMENNEIVFAKVINTDSNMVCRDVFIKCGFASSNANNELFCLSGGKVASPQHITIVSCI